LLVAIRLLVGKARPQVIAGLALAAHRGECGHAQRDDDVDLVLLLEPDWNPPEEMIVRQPYLPRFMAGGETNPLGARALYLGKTVSGRPA
jgi:hypothetical protein